MPEITTKGPDLLGQTATVATSVAKALEDAGVRVVFGLDDPQALWHSLRALDSIETVIVHDERSGAFMADAYARAAGTVGVCGAISGPGATNLATGLWEARTAHVPLVAIVGESPAAAPGGHSFQAAPHELTLAPLVKEVVRIDRPQDAIAATRRALDVATSGCPGPVLILAGDEELWEPFEDPARDLPSQGGVRLRPRPEPESVSAAAQLLAGASRPMILAGGGAQASAASEPLVQLAERLGAPVATSMMGKGSIADDHPLSVGVVSAYNGSPRGRGEVAEALLNRADVLLVVGSDLDSVTTSGDAWPAPETQLVRIDIDPGELSGRPSLPLLGDAREALRSLVEAIDADPAAVAEWTAEARSLTARKTEMLSELDREASGDGFVWPGAVMTVISEGVAKGDAVVTDASYSSAWVMDRLWQDFPGHTAFAPRGCGVLGWGLPAALGVKVARPDSRVTLVTGDGGLLFTIGELETATRLDLDLTVVLLNNRSFGYQRQADMLWQGNEDMPDLRFGEQADFAAIAAGFGWATAQVDDPGDFAAAYREAADAGPTFIDVSVHPDVRPPITKMDLD